MQRFKFSLLVGACVLGLAVAARAEDNAAQAAARAAVLAQLAQFDAAPTPPSAPAPKPVMPAPAVVAPVVLPPSAPGVVVAEGDNAAQARARAALAQQNIVVAPAAPVIKAQPVMTANTAPVTFPVVVAPAPAPNSKEGRLQALNARYKAGQIAPLDYFNQREAILNGN